nr:collagen-like protein [Actinomyces oris]
MTQPPNPGQPFYQQQPSAPSAPVPGQPYPPQQQFQGAPGAPAAPGAPGQPFAQAPAGDSFMGNLFDTAKPFVEKFGKVVFYIAAIALVVNWLYSAYNAGDLGGTYDIESQGRSFNFGKFLLSLLFDAPWVVAQIGLIRLFIELVINSAKKN